MADVAERETALPTPLERLLAGLSRQGRRELYRALKITLAEPRRAADRRLAELGCLRRLLAKHGEWPSAPPANAAKSQLRARSIGALSPDERFPTMTRERYDELRDTDAPTSRALLRRHRTDSWALVCRMAGGIEIDGKRLSRGLPWVNHWRRGPSPSQRVYSRHECEAAIRHVAEQLECSPKELTTSNYQSWATAERRRLRAIGEPDPRYPGWGPIYRLYGSWRRAIECTVKSRAPRRLK